MKETYLPIMRCPVYRRRDSNLGFRTELENLADDGKGKGTSGGPTRPKVLKRQLGADCSVIALNWGNARGAREQATRVGIDQSQRATGGTRWFRRKAAASKGWHEPCKSRDLRTVL